MSTITNFTKYIIDSDDYPIIIGKEMKGIAKRNLSTHLINVASQHLNNEFFTKCILYSKYYEIDTSVFVDNEILEQVKKISFRRDLPYSDMLQEYLERIDTLDQFSKDLIAALKINDILFLKDKRNSYLYGAFYSYLIEVVRKCKVKNFDLLIFDQDFYDNPLRIFTSLKLWKLAWNSFIPYFER